MPLSVSRRDFVQWSLALGAAAILPRQLSAAPTPGLPKSLTAMPGTAIPATPMAAAAPRFDHLALLSDVHVSGGFNTGMAKRLSVAVDQVIGLPQKPQKVLVSGDCAYLTGVDEDYREYVRRIQPLVDAGYPVHMTLGNHDNRDRFWDALPREQPKARVALRRQSMVVPGHFANWFLLDSLGQTNRDGGELGWDQLEWLVAELDARKDKPAILMVHHDLVRHGKPGALKDAESLLEVTRPRRHVKAIVFGHTHVWDCTVDRSGIHLVNLPATGYTLWMKSFMGWVDCRVYGDNATLKVNTINAGEDENGRTVVLRWRSAKA